MVLSFLSCQVVSSLLHERIEGAREREREEEGTKSDVETCKQEREGDEQTNRPLFPRRTESFELRGFRSRLDG